MQEPNSLLQVCELFVLTIKLTYFMNDKTDFNEELANFMALHCFQINQYTILAKLVMKTYG